MPPCVGPAMAGLSLRSPHGLNLCKKGVLSGEILVSAVSLEHLLKTVDTPFTFCGISLWDRPLSVMSLTYFRCNPF